MTPEGLIKRAICQLLAHYPKRCMFWVTQSHGVFDPKTGRFRKLNSPYQRLGQADIIGIWDGKPLAIEVKSLKGQPSDHQLKFLKDFEDHGGIAMIARSAIEVGHRLGIISELTQPPV